MDGPETGKVIHSTRLLAFKHGKDPPSSNFPNANATELLSFSIIPAGQKVVDILSILAAPFGPPPAAASPPPARARPGHQGPRLQRDGHDEGRRGGGGGGGETSSEERPLKLADRQK